MYSKKRGSSLVSQKTKRLFRALRSKRGAKKSYGRRRNRLMYGGYAFMENGGDESMMGGLTTTDETVPENPTEPKEGDEEDTMNDTTDASGDDTKPADATDVAAKPLDEGSDSILQGESTSSSDDLKTMLESLTKRVEKLEQWKNAPLDSLT